MAIGVLGPLDKIQKKIKKEEAKLEQEIEKEHVKYEQEIDKVSDFNVSSLKRDAEILGQEIHDKGIELDKTMSESNEKKKAEKRKRKRRR